MNKRMWICPTDNGAVGDCWHNACSEPRDGYVEYAPVQRPVQRAAKLAGQAMGVLVIAGLAFFITAKAVEIFVGISDIMAIL